MISGTWDVVVPPSVSASIAAAIPGSELVTVARTGHFVPRDAPDGGGRRPCDGVEARAMDADETDRSPDEVDEAGA